MGEWAHQFQEESSDEPTVVGSSNIEDMEDIISLLLQCTRNGSIKWDSYGDRKIRSEIDGMYAYTLERKLLRTINYYVFFIDSLAEPRSVYVRSYEGEMNGVYDVLDGIMKIATRRNKKKNRGLIDSAKESLLRLTDKPSGAI